MKPMQKTFYKFDLTICADHAFLKVEYTSPEIKYSNGRLKKLSSKMRYQSSLDLTFDLIGFVEDFANGFISFVQQKNINTFSSIAAQKDWFEQTGRRVQLVQSPEVQKNIYKVFTKQLKLELPDEQKKYVLIDTINGKSNFVRFSHGREYRLDKPAYVNGAKGKQLQRIHSNVQAFLYDSKKKTVEDYLEGKAAN